MRRIYSPGCEVIHLGHDRSVEDIVKCAIQEDANSIAVTSYQGGHKEFFMYMFDLLKLIMLLTLKFWRRRNNTSFEINSLHKYELKEFIIPMMVEKWD